MPKKYSDQNFASLKTPTPGTSSTMRKNYCHSVKINPGDPLEINECSYLPPKSTPTICCPKFTDVDQCHRICLLPKPKKKEIEPLSCYAENSKNVCPSCKESCRIKKKRLQKDCCYCRVPETKEVVTSRKAGDKASEHDRRYLAIKNTRPQKPPKEIKTCTKNLSGNKSSRKELKARKICDNQDQQVVFRSCDCHEIKKPKSEKLACCSKLLCCSCFTKIRKRKKSKVCTAPCKQYFCPYNTGRSKCKEPAVPCVKCTQNCSKVGAHSEDTRKPEKKQRKLRAKTATIAAAEPSTTTCSNSASESVPENSTTEDKNQEIKCSKFTKRKPSHNQKRKTNKIPPIPSGVQRHSSNVPETEADGKVVPCIKNPKKVSSQASCKKLTFVSCTELHEYKVESAVKKKRTVMGIVFDVIFWPYVFWPRGDLCR